MTPETTHAALLAARDALTEAWTDLHEWVRTTRYAREHVPIEHRHHIGHERGMAETEAIRGRIQDACKLVDAALAAQPAGPSCGAPSRACKANRTADPPQDCDWPFCGCDEHATKVIETLVECGWSAPQPGTGHYLGVLHTCAECNEPLHMIPTCKRCDQPRASKGAVHGEAEPAPAAETGSTHGVTREQVEALQLDHAPSTYVEQGWEDAIEAVLRLCPADAPRPTHTPDGEEIIGWTAPQPARPIVRAKAKFYPNPEDGADAPAQETTPEPRAKR